MSRHKDIRNLDYNEVVDEYDQAYDDDDPEPTPEERVIMANGTAEIRSMLAGEASKVTKAQIEEALWHYYFDVDKAAAYLVSKFIAPKPKKTPQNGDEYAIPMVSHIATPNTSRESFAHLFRDLPWGNIPKDRETVFIAPQRPRGGLLGGSGAAPRMSKLQMLAAARKQKAEEKNAQEKVEQTRVKMAELAVDEKSRVKENVPLAGAFSKRLKTSESTAEGRMPLADAESTAIELPHQRMADVPETSTTTASLLTTSASSETPTHIIPEPQREPPVAAAQPSAFARTLFGPPPPPKPQLAEFFSPYPSLPPSVIEAFSKPSPDDVVLTAQAKAGKKTKKKGSSSTDAVTSEVKALKIEDAPLPKSRNLNVLSEFENSKKKKTASFVVVGHVDAGKSTMMGRLLLDLGVVDQRTVDKLRQEAEKIGKTSFALAWVLDQRSEERARGVTIDIATNRFETDKTAFTILDAPGHRDFIPNMIAGASQADFAILVIDASTGAFESGLKGQTREHSLLIRSMGVSRIVVAVNKLDTVGWSQERFEEIKHQVHGFLSGTGFQSKNIAFVPLSGLRGDNLVRKTTEPAAGWYTGPTLVEELENSEPSARALSKPLRMTISEVFRTPQSPLSISGRIDAGSLQMGDALLVQPSGEKAYIKSLMMDEEPTDWAVAGQNVVIHLSNIDPMHVRVGDIICDPAKPIQCLDTFTLKALAFDFLMPMQVDVHRGRLHAAGKIEAIDALLDKVTGSVIKKKPKVVKPASVARIRVTLASKVPLEAGQRVVLRSGGETVAAGLLE
ncbi:P-loop containing nucleoside triphosphate hydrolase protein [Cercophora scortea]|uniref:Elongation factor 1 alpha-like protein n=1 Tax=Cercophora scortea TaxID=314031 RepID=A0AAE0MI69_9PEZI|nr:P-loop containing nucleoside triphosphate hydrolase protein [Cercophora scortea]